MTLDVRTITEDELPAFSAAWGLGFLHPTEDAEADAKARRGGTVLDRTWAGFDGDRIVATTRSFPVALTVPGGAAVDVSAITSVSTLSTHRRRGLATRLMTADLGAARARGEVAAVLHASEWGIYGRFGFGPASSECTLVVDAAAQLREPVAGSAELVDRDTARALLPEIYAGYLAATSGEISRNDWAFDLSLGILRLPSRDRVKPGFHVIVRDVEGRAVGFCRYEVEDRWEQSRARHLVSSSLFVAVNDTGTALLWQHLLSLDLVAEIRVEVRPVDDPLPYLVTDGRQVRRHEPIDSLWLRLLDVPAALSARRYRTSGRLMLEVADRLGYGAGRFVLSVADGAATCEPTDEPADLTMDISTLSSLYLGGVGAKTLHRAGLIEVGDPALADVADTMFGWGTAPSCTTMF
ncbi:GNAT family N-acetyltransferase [Nakamurella panacisegetis]|nr:GNAT family N-acetyltransferase [Nakamurella panacisegetis]